VTNTETEYPAGPHVDRPYTFTVLGQAQNAPATTSTRSPPGTLPWLGQDGEP